MPLDYAHGPDAARPFRPAWREFAGLILLALLMASIGGAVLVVGSVLLMDELVPG